MNWDTAFSCPLFCGIERETAAQVLAGSGGELREYAKGDKIYTPETFSHSLGILLEGTVRVTRRGWPVSILHPGELFGAAALYGLEEEYLVTLTAQSPCTALLLPQENLDQLLIGRPKLALNYIAYLSGRIRFLGGQLEALSTSSAEERVLRYLAAHGENGAFQPDCSWTELAGRLGLGRATLYRVLDNLCEAGTIRREGKWIYENTEGKEEIL